MTTGAFTLIDELIKQGVANIFFSPGSRSTPLIFALSQRAQLRSYSHFDERAMAFFALGYAKASNEPAVIVTTSGSAVGNLLPAVMEAKEAQIPLLLLTADRPFELQECGANQATNQVKIFESHIGYSLDIPLCDQALSPQCIAKTVAYAYFRTTSPQPGPVQINCRFREPFSFVTQPFSDTPSTFYLSSEPSLSSSALRPLLQHIHSQKEGVLIVGANRDPKLHQSATALAKKMQWPLLTDPLSGMRAADPRCCQIAHYNLLLPQMPPPKAVIHLGDKIVSKPLQEWLGAAKPPFYLHVANHSLQHDPGHLVSHRLTTSLSSFCRSLASHLSSSPPSPWSKKWIKESSQIQTTLKSFFTSHPSTSEPALFHLLQQALPSSTALFIGNSMPIRDTDCFFFPKKPPCFLTANRGLSGIDGNIATAAGTAMALQKPLVAVLGDLTALHDLNALALIASSPSPILLIIINNQGGGIFSFLPVAQKRQLLDPFFATPHQISFQEAAALFRLPYLKLKECKELLPLLKRPITTVIEIAADRKENLLLHKEIARLCSVIKK